MQPQPGTVDAALQAVATASPTGAVPEQVYAYLAEAGVDPHLQQASSDVDTQVWFDVFGLLEQHAPTVDLAVLGQHDAHLQGLLTSYQPSVGDPGGREIAPADAGSEPQEVAPADVSSEPQEVAPADAGSEPQETAWEDLPPDIKRVFSQMVADKDRAALTQIDMVTHAAIGCAGKPGVQGVSTQEELDALLANIGTTKIIHLMAGGPGEFSVTTKLPRGVHIHAHDLVHITASGTANWIYSFGPASITASDNAQVHSRKTGPIIASGNAQVYTMGSGKITASDNVSVTSGGDSQVTLTGNARIYAHQGGQISAYDNAFAYVSRTAQVTAHNNASVRTEGSGQIYAFDNVAVDAGLDAIVIASDMVTVAYRHSAKVIATDPTVTLTYSPWP